MIRFEHTLETTTDCATTFAVLDDLSQATRWLSRCVGVERATITPGPNAVGTKLRYLYQEGRRLHVTHGEIVARTVNEQLTFRFTADPTNLTLDFRMGPDGSGSKLICTFEFAPQSALSWLFTHLLRGELRQQTNEVVERLRPLLGRTKG